jgi:uncharacterized protein YjiK
MNQVIDLDNPIKIIELPDKLKEISGISYYRKDQLLCHNDESSDIYIIDYQVDKIVNYENQSIKGDFEDIVFIDGKIYMLKSNGYIYEFDQNAGLQSKQIKYTSELDKLNNCEGLAYDKQTNSLLIACKEKSTLKDSSDIPESKSIYRFNLETKKLINQPFITVNLNELKNNFGIEKFKPSGIAVHPKTGNIYLLASVGKSLLVIDREGKVLKVYRLKSSIFQQPEGICFDPFGGFLFISNEGKNGVANLLIFKL